MNNYILHLLGQLSLKDNIIAGSIYFILLVFHKNIAINLTFNIYKNYNLMKYISIYCGKCIDLYIHEYERNNLFVKP